MIINLNNLVQKNEKTLENFVLFIDNLKPEEEKNPGLSFKHRFLIYGIESAVGGYLSTESSLYQNEIALTLAERAATILLGTLNKDGTVNSVNMASPPDTAFVAERTGALMILLKKRRENIPGADRLYAILEKYLKKTCDALVTGGVHTPNHRWILSSALAYGFHLLKEDSYRIRALQWLEEKIDIDDEGQFSERSISIYSPLIVHGLINLADFLDLEYLLEVVRRHLDMARLYFKPDGKLIIHSSRRQDAFHEGISGHYFLPYLIMAERDNRSEYSEAALFIEKTGHTPSLGLTEILSGRIRNQLPEPIESLPVKGDYYLAGSGLFRSSSVDRFFTVFGGCDQMEPFSQMSGLSGNPTFFSLQSGACSLESVRIAPNFFNTGYFRAQNMEYKENRCTLRQSLKVPYYDHLKKENLDPRGNYALTSTGRYWSKMDFPSRDQVNVQELQTLVIIEFSHREISLTINCQGCSSVPVSLEFMFPNEGVLQGNWYDTSQNLSVFENPPSSAPKNMKILKDGPVRYSNGGGEIILEPGIGKHDWIPVYNEDLFFPLGKVKNSNQFVYMTFYTPFTYGVTIKF